MNKTNEVYPNDSLQFIYKQFIPSVHIRLISILIQCGVCDILYESSTPISYIELAKLTKVSEEGMNKMLRYFSYYKVVENDKSNLDLYSKSEYTVLFTKNSIYHDMIDMWSSDLYYDIMKSIPLSIKKGESGVSESMGSPTWDLFNSNDNYNRFKNTMFAITHTFIKQIIDNIDFNHASIVCDVGGSHGELVKKIVDKYEHINGINFDLEKVISNTKSNNPRLTHVVGSFFDSVPSADAYVLKLILHDWSDEECIKILKTISKSIMPNGKVYVFDYILDPQDLDSTILWYDIKMFHYFSGKERTINEFKYIVNEAGFKIETVFNNKTISCGGVLLSKR